MTNDFSSILEGKSLVDLRAIATQMGIPGCDKMRKSQIISAITGDAAPVAETPKKQKKTDDKAKAKPTSTRTKKAKSDSEPAADNAAETPVVTEAENAPVAEVVAEAPVTEDAPAKQEKKPAAKRGRKPKAAKAEEPKAEPVAESEVAEVKPQETQAEVVPEATEETVQVQITETPKGRRSYSRRKTAQKKVEATEAESVTDSAVTEAEAPAQDAESAETPAQPPKPEPIPDDDIEGVLEIMADGYGFLRTRNYLSGSDDIYVSPSQIKRFGLRPGDRVTGKARRPARGEKFRALSYIGLLNGDDYATMEKRPRFETLTPIYPESKLMLETLDANNRSKEITSRLLDIMAPIGKGQRGLIVSPPKAGKTELLKKIAHGITTNHPDVHLIVLLIDERPEEVTDMQRSIKGEIVYSTFDEEPEHHVKVSEMVQEHAKRMVEQGKDVVVLMDSLTRLTRAYNLTITNSGRTMSGGMDTAALIKPKKFLGAARNIEFGGSLTIIATALVDTGSKMDDLIYEEFKGTGNLEIHLDRKLSERRIFPAIDIYKSGTRRDDLLLAPAEKEAADKIRRAFSQMGIAECTEMVINQMLKTPNNNSFLMTVKV